MFSANSSQVSDSKLFVEDVFSTYLYTGNGSTQTITNGIDLAGKGGLVWIKNRTSSTDPLHYLNFKDGSDIVSNNSNNTSAKQVMTPYAAFNSDGFFVNALPGFLNNSGVNYASWTFREAPKFFDVVTYTGNGANRTIAHNLGVAPGMIIVKRTDTTGNWQVYHRGLSSAANSIQLNLTSAQAAASTVWNSTTPTATEFTVGTDATVNASGGTYVAYLYAHDTSSTGLIQCGSYTETGSAVTVNLGWEPQWLMVKRTDSTGNWVITDNMRTLNMSTTNGAVLFPNTSGAETNDPYWHPTATGFVADPYWGSGASVVYIAIRRGPMRTPTLGTSVFAPVTRTGTGATVYTTTSGFAPDSVWMDARSQSGKGPGLFDRLRGLPQLLQTTTTSSEVTNAGYIGLMGNTGYTSNADAYYNTSSQTFVDWIFRRAPGFFDEVCYTGDGTYGTTNHNLGVVPELIITKARSNTEFWTVDTPNGNGSQGRLASSGAWITTWGPGNPVATSTIFAKCWDSSNVTYVAYLFASAPGVSKVGTYTGNGSSQTINCGFAAGARFVMIKRTDSTGDWYVWDTARGIVAGNDPHLSLNTTAAEVTTDDTIDTDSSGFVVNQDAATNVNVNAATYIYLAIA